MEIIIVTIIGIVLRLVSLNQSFWLDEAASVEIASRPLAQFFSQLKYDFHPPFFYLVLKPLTYVFHSEILLRAPFVFISSISILGIYLLTKELVNTKSSRLPLLVSIFLSLNPLHIYYSQELRMYGLNTVLSIFSWLYLIRWVKSSKKRDLYFHILFSVLNLYTFYGAFINLIAQFVYLICQNKASRYIPFLLVQGIFCLPMIQFLPEQLANGGYLKQTLPKWSDLSGKATLKDLGLIFVKFSIGRISLNPQKLYFLIGGMVSLHTLLLTLLPIKIKKLSPVYFWLVLPISISFILSLVTPMMGYWRYIYVLPAFIILIAFGISRLPKILSLLSIGLIIMISIFSNLYFWYMPSFQREDWRGLTSKINTPNSLVIINFPYNFTTLKYYLPNSNTFLTQSELGKIKPNLDKELKTEVKKYQHLYYLSYLGDLTDPNQLALKSINKIGLIPVTAYSFVGVGTVTEFKNPPNILK